MQRLTNDQMNELFDRVSSISPYNKKDENGKTIHLQALSDHHMRLLSEAVETDDKDMQKKLFDEALSFTVVESLNLQLMHVIWGLKELFERVKDLEDNVTAD